MAGNVRVKVSVGERLIGVHGQGPKLRLASRLPRLLLLLLCIAGLERRVSSAEESLRSISGAWSRLENWLARTGAVRDIEPELLASEENLAKLGGFASVFSAPSSTEVLAVVRRLARGARSGAACDEQLLTSLRLVERTRPALAELAGEERAPALRVDRLLHAHVQQVAPKCDRFIEQFVAGELVGTIRRRSRATRAAFELFVARAAEEHFERARAWVRLPSGAPAPLAQHYAHSLVGLFREMILESSARYAAAVAERRRGGGARRPGLGAPAPARELSLAYNFANLFWAPCRRYNATAAKVFAYASSLANLQAGKEQAFLARRSDAFKLALFMAQFCRYVDDVWTWPRRASYFERLFGGL